MAGLSGIVKKISDLVTGTPADDDCFVFGKSDFKKITLAKLKDALGITSINSALEGRNFAGGEVAAHSYQDVTFTFNKKHSSAPVVVACLEGKADTLHRASINLSVFDKTNTGFKVRIYNDSEAMVNVGLSWIALET